MFGSFVLKCEKFDHNTQYLYNHHGYGHNGFEGWDSHTKASDWCSGMVIAPTVLKTCIHILNKKYNVFFEKCR